MSRSGHSNNIHESPVPFIEGGSYPVRHGNRVRPLVDSAPAFRRICEAIDAAKHSVWLTVTFMAPDFQMPDNRGSVIEVLDHAAERGLDVRIIFWRPNPESSGYGQAFPGTQADRDMLTARGSNFSARWDRSPGYFCQHQKSWLIDAGHSSETAFVGGINPTFMTFEPGHAGEGHRHDVYVEVSGPAATDVHHNFVQRWNEASERMEEDGIWGHGGGDELAFPTSVSAISGDTLLQIQRNVSAGRYSNDFPTPGGAPFDIAAGERSIFEQYKQAIDAARSTIYIENQALPVPEITARLEEALKRGVDVVFLIPAEPEEYVRKFRRQPDSSSFFEPIEALGQYGNFTLAGIAGPNRQGGRSNVYVHAKIMLIDDEWATIGSCNLHWNSLFGHTEMNAAFFDPKAVRALRNQLFSEHLGQETTQLTGREALRLYRDIAHDNRLSGARGEFSWKGLAFMLDPKTYGE